MMVALSMMTLDTASNPPIISPMKDQNNKSKFFIIFIDDEENAVKYFQKIFGQEFNIIATSDPKEVLRIIDNRPGEIAVVVSDQKMPLASGVNLLSEIKEKNHSIIRILTTAYASLEDNIEAINKSNIFAYLSKPWDLNEVVIILHKALNEFESRRNYLSLSGSIAHEMRNPLNNARQSSKFVRDKLIDANLLEKFCCDNLNEKITPLTKKDFQEIIDSLDIAFSSAKRGNILIDVILDSIRERPVDVKSFRDITVSGILKLVMEEYSFKASDKARVVIDVQPEHDFSFKGNDTLLSYVFFNLLKNSLYYTKSYPNLTITIRSEIGEDKFNRIYVRDNGPGIPHNKLSNLFEAFASSGKEGGTGLGLSFCKRTLKSFGGSISCNSVEGEFSEFILALPKVLKRQKIQSINRILLVDDQLTSLTLSKKLLEKNLESTVCDIAETGAAAAELVEKHNYDLILMDIEMPEMDGIATTIKIREFDRETPIIAYSGQDLRPLIDRLKLTEFDGYLSKSESNDMLLKTVSKWGLIRLKNPLLQEKEIEEFLRNKKILLADDEAVNLILTAKYLGKYAVKADEVRDGEDALKMAKTNDYDVILMDISMPELDGIAATKKIREFQRQNNLKEIPIIAFTGEGSKEKVHEILNAGFNDYFIKGRDYRELIESIFFSSENKK